MFGFSIFMFCMSVAGLVFSILTEQWLLVLLSIFNITIWAYHVGDDYDR